jgi:pilus assembly protein CpaB
MNQNRMLIGFAIAIVVALLFSTYVYNKFKEASSQKTVVSTQRIVVAAVPLQLGQRLDANNLKTIPWPSGEQVVGSFSRIEDCINRALITPVAANEMIIEGKLASREAGAGLPATIPEGMRAISVAVNEVVGVAGFVIPGTLVDVLVTGKATNGSENLTRTILENVRVLAAGQKIEQDREGKPQTVPVITLLVTPEDAARLAMASTEGKIQLALRNTIDSKKVNPPTVMEAALFGGVSSPVKRTGPAPKALPPTPPSPYVIEVITGSKRENKSFPSTPAEHP